jgi:hypothetical protein
VQGDIGDIIRLVSEEQYEHSPTPRISSSATAELFSARDNCVQVGAHIELYSDVRTSAS